jgi:AraC-like DNA-binding protein
MTIFIYWLGIKGYIISQQKNFQDKKPAVNSTVSPQLAEQVITKLKKVMSDEKIYLNPTLNLAILSETTGISAKTISHVLNRHLQKSFNEFINGYRISEFKAKILQPDMSNLTIAGVACECGFNSQATFQRTFKELTGQSPSEFRKTAHTLS